MTSIAHATVNANADATGNAVVIDGLRFRWSDTAPHVLTVPRLEVKPGERVFIGGPSGSGKSTLLSLLAGIVMPQEGSVSLLGHRLTGMSASARDRFRADHVGYIFQLFNLVPYLTVLENVTLPLRFSARRLEQARAAGKGHVDDEARRLLDHLGMGGADVLHRPVTELSVGQQQRVAAARALMGGPEILIADEPTSSLDAGNRETFINLLFAECAMSKATLVFVSHDTSLAKLFDRQIPLGMEDGT
jgi:putative ABC transport system ATP-binding protein